MTEPGGNYEALSAADGSLTATRLPASRRLTLVISSLAGGGAERVMSQLANHWADAGREVTLITLSAETGDSYPLSSGVRRIALDGLKESRSLPAAVWNNAVRLGRLRRAIKESQPDVVLSFTGTVNVLSLLSAIGLGVDVVISERVDPVWHNIGPIWSRLRRLLYPRCRALVVQTERARERLHDVAGGRPIYVIPNAAVPPATDPGTSAAAELVPEYTRSPQRTVLAMGRLEPQKGFDLLIEAFSKIAAGHPQWTLRILGEGSQRAALQALAKARAPSSRVELAGWVPHPEHELRRADLFVLSSRYEGFPNVLLEAMASGVAAVSFDCDCGPREIVRHEVDGLLVPGEDVEALARAMERLMSDDMERTRLAAAAVDVVERFPMSGFFQRWEAVLSAAEANAAMA